MRHVARTKLRAVDVDERLHERADFRTANRRLALAAHAADGQLKPHGLRSTARVDLGGRAKIRLMIIHDSRVDFYKAALFISTQPDRALRIAAIVVFHLSDECDRRAFSSETFARRLDGKRAHPSREPRAPRGGREQIMRKMHDGLRAIARDDRGVIAHADELPCPAHEDHFVEHPRREAEAQGERLAALHLVLRAELRPERRVRAFKKRVVDSANAVELKSRHIKPGGFGIAGREIGWDEFEGMKHGGESNGNAGGPRSNARRLVSTQAK